MLQSRKSQELADDLIHVLHKDPKILSPTKPDSTQRALLQIAKLLLHKKPTTKILHKIQGIEALLTKFVQIPKQRNVKKKQNIRDLPSHRVTSYTPITNIYVSKKTSSPHPMLLRRRYLLTGHNQREYYKSRSAKDLLAQLMTNGVLHLFDSAGKKIFRFPVERKPYNMG